MKVFCVDCKFQEVHSFNNNDRIVCMCPYNLEDSWYAKKFKLISTPDKINENNNCKWFVDRLNKTVAG